jgi:hypothetical protein
MPPDNAGYMVAAYVVTAVVLLGYAGSLLKRAMTLNREKGKR